MQVNISNLNPGTSYPYPEGGTVVLRKVPPVVSMEIHDTRAKTETDFVPSKTWNIEMKQWEEDGTTQRIDTRKPGGIEVMHDFWDYAIVSWDFTDEASNPLPCTRGNKVALMKGDPLFNAFVEGKIKALGLELDEKLKAQAKNL